MPAVIIASSAPDVGHTDSMESVNPNLPITQATTSPTTSSTHQIPHQYTPCLHQPHGPSPTHAPARSQ